MQRRKRGTGSVGQRKSDGRWFASIVMAPAEDGRRRRQVRYATSRAEAEAIVATMTSDAPPKVPATRFWQLVDQTPANGCWAWTGTRTHGYGQFWDGARRVPAHRWAYEHLVEPIPEGLTIDHLCRNKRCVNPQHLEPVTLAENQRRSRAYWAAWQATRRIWIPVGVIR